MVVGDFALELDTVVIGSGPGGYVAAIRAAQLGKKVAIVERGSIGGVCLNVGCIPSKALINVGHRYQDSLNSSTFGVEAKDVTLDFEKAQKWKDDEVVSKLTGGVEMLLKKNKVEIIKGEAFFNDKNQFRVIDAESAQSYTFNDAIIATGSRPIEIKGFKFGGRVLDSSGVLALQEVPKHLVVIGGGYIGSELANAYANLGSKITILEAQPDILMGFDKDMVALAKKDFVEKGMTIIPNAFAQQAKETENGIAVTYKVDDKEETIDADYVLVSVGRRPNTDNLGLHLANVDVDERGIVKVDKQGRTSNPNIYAIGDITPGAALAHKASYEAKVAAAAIAGQNSEIDYVAMPAVCFTDVELATVGLTQQQAKDQGISVKVSKFPFEANGRALSLAATEGFVRILTDKETGTVLGGQVAGVNAGEMVGELTLAIEGRMNIEDISLTIHAHPTISETIMDAAELAQGLPIHI